MKCPYCEQDHPNGTLICPNTGQALGEFGREETGGQMPFPGQAPEPAQARPVSTAPENLPKASLNASVESSQPTEFLASQNAQIYPGEASSATPLPTIASRKQPATPWIIGGCLGIPLFILLVLAVLIFADPLNLHVWGRVNGRYDAAAEVMPADTDVYLGINIGNGILTRFNRVIEPFMLAGQSTGVMGLAPAHVDRMPALQTNPLDDLLQELENETGMKLPEDLSPWIGQYAGVGILGFEDSNGGTPTPTGFIVAIEARNLRHADEFLATLRDNLTEKQGVNFESQTYHGVKIYVEKGSTGMAFGRNGRMVVLASSLDILRKAVDRQENQALPTEMDYSDLINVRARDWTASFYFNHAWIGDYFKNLMDGSLSAAGSLINPNTGLNWTGVLLSISAIRGGARLDMYMEYDESTQTAAQLTQIQNSYTAASQVIGVLPKDTVFFVASTRFNIILGSILASAFENQSDIDDFWTTSEQALGFSLKDDLIDQLTGEWALYAVPSTRGLLPNQADVNLAISLLAQTVGELDVSPITDGLNRNAMLTGITVNQKVRDGFTYYELGMIGEGDPMLAFGASNGFFTLGTDGETLQISPIEGNLLVESDNYQTAIHAMPGEMTLAMYIDLENLFANLREGMPASARQEFNASMRVLAPINTITLGGRYMEKGITQSSFVIMLAGD